MNTIDAATLKGWEAGESQFAFVDVREFGIHGESHPLFSVSIPYSRFEARIDAMVPNRHTPLVLMDDGVSGHAATCGSIAERAGYARVYVLDGGHAAWQAAGYNLFSGVNVPSKVFGEIVMEEMHTPTISAADLMALRTGGGTVAVIDGRPLSEFGKMNIPGATCCPNGELALRIDAICPDPEATIVVNCAGRTRSVIGAETLRKLGVRNPVYALENGTMGWYLQDFELEYGSVGKLADVDAEALPGLRRRTAEFAASCGVRVLDAAAASAWLKDERRTCYVFDVRDERETIENPIAGTVHAPGGQLIQATDQWVGVRQGRILLVDGDGIRAPVVSYWLNQMGFEAAALDPDELPRMRFPERAATARNLHPALKVISARDLVNELARGSTAVVDLRASMSFRAGHIPGSIWTIRPRFAELMKTVRPASIVLLCDDEVVAASAASDLGSEFPTPMLLEGSFEGWRDCGLPTESSKDIPADADCIDYLFFVHDRHDGNRQAAKQYLKWETDLLERLDASEYRALNRNRTNK